MMGIDDAAVGLTDDLRLLSMASTNRPEATLDTTELLIYAKLVNRLYDKTQVLPAGWHEWKISRASLLSPMDALRFDSHAPRIAVVAFRGVDLFDIRDLIGVPLKRLFGYSASNVRYCERFFNLYPANCRRVVIGHSGGAGLASWVASRLGAESVVFNGGRPRQARENDGRRQVVVVVKGDRWGDPIAHPELGPALPGATVELKALPGENTHAMSTIVAALERQIKGGG